MAERRGNWQKAEDDLPVYLARPGTADQVPRQKYGGLFCSVEDAFESKTIDFDALSVGQRGSRTPRTAQRETGEEARSPASCDQSTAGEESPAANRRGGKDSPQVETRTSGDKEVLQNLGDEKVRGLELRRDWRLVSAARVFFFSRSGSYKKWHCCGGYLFYIPSFFTFELFWKPMFSNLLLRYLRLSILCEKCRTGFIEGIEGYRRF